MSNSGILFVRMCFSSIPLKTTDTHCFNIFASFFCNTITPMFQFFSPLHIWVNHSFFKLQVVVLDVKSFHFNPNVVFYWLSLLPWPFLLLPSAAVLLSITLLPRSKCLMRRSDWAAIPEHFTKIQSSCIEIHQTIGPREILNNLWRGGFPLRSAFYAVDLMRLGMIHTPRTWAGAWWRGERQSVQYKCKAWNIYIYVRFYSNLSF